MLAGYLRRLDPRLPRVLWLVQGGGVVNSFGNGMAFPFIVIYLHNVRGISFAAAGFSLAAGAVAALFAGSAPARWSTGSAGATRCCSAYCSNRPPSRSSR